MDKGQEIKEIKMGVLFFFFLFFFSGDKRDKNGCPILYQSVYHALARLAVDITDQATQPDTAVVQYFMKTVLFIGSLLDQRVSSASQ